MTKPVLLKVAAVGAVIASIGLSALGEPLRVQAWPTVKASTQNPYQPPQHEEAIWLDTGRHAGAPAESAISPVEPGPAGLAFSDVIEVKGAPWLRLHLGDYQLGPGSYLLLTALEDGAWQRLDAASLPDWYNASAYFNGDAVKVELYVAPGDQGAYAQFDRLTVGERGATLLSRWTGGDFAPESLCGGDSRVASNDGRVGRLYVGGCTAWLVSNGAVLTAGHCTDFDPDGGGPQLPNGTNDLSGVVEFDVPASDADGTPNMAAPNNQYPVNTTGTRWRFDGEGQGLGKDWSVFRINPNANTGARAHAVRGFFRMTNVTPATTQTIRITGHGADNSPAGSTGGDNAQNVTNQTSTGSYEGRFTGNTAADLFHTYKVDTMPASSGSPIIWDNNGYTIGIHTNGGCASDGSGANGGTSFDVDALENALQIFPAGTTRYADTAAPYLGGGENGLIYMPYNTVNEAVGAVPAGGTVSIVAGTYDEPAQTINKQVTLVAPVGTVVIR